MSSQLFLAILDIAKLPEPFAQSILTNNGSFARFIEYGDLGGSMVPTSLCRYIRSLAYRKENCS